MAITMSGARVVLADVDPHTLTLTAAEIEARRTQQTRAVIPVHLFGQPADMTSIMAAADAHHLMVIEDATLAVGAEHSGRRAGTFGLTGCYSFSPGKILGSYGDGGAITTDDPAIAERLLVLRNYGHDISMTNERGATHFGGLWNIAAEGFNDRLDTLQAAILSAKLPTLDDRITARRRIARPTTSASPASTSKPTHRFGRPPRLPRLHHPGRQPRSGPRPPRHRPGSPHSSTTPHPSTFNPPMPISTSAPAPSR